MGWFRKKNPKKGSSDAPPNLSNIIMETRADVDVLQRRFRELMDEWSEVHGKFQVLSGRIVKLRQEIDGTHKGGENSRARQRDERRSRTIEEQRIEVERRMKRGA